MSTFQLDPNQVALGVGAMGTTQAATVTTSSVQMTAFGADTTLIRIACANGHCHFAIGTNPTASITTSPLIGNNRSEIIAVTVTVEVVTAASLIKAIFCPGVTAIISDRLLPINGLVVIEAVGLVPIAK